MARSCFCALALLSIEEGTENARLENAGPSKNAGSENARLENKALNCRTGKRGERHVWKAKWCTRHMWYLVYCSINAYSFSKTPLIQCSCSPGHESVQHRKRVIRVLDEDRK